MGLWPRLAVPAPARCPCSRSGLTALSGIRSIRPAHKESVDWLLQVFSIFLAAAAAEWRTDTWKTNASDRHDTLSRPNEDDLWRGPGDRDALGSGCLPGSGLRRRRLFAGGHRGIAAGPRGGRP